ncbi:MAG TPA: hypothetical protein VKB69_00800 [Micromonosporaceae bacterium]|nr:hypothetical protein [Micromonosporaceae bacterium]
MWWIVGVVAVVVAVATYLTWIAGRVDRLHRRAAASATALEAALDRRAAAGIDAAESMGLPDLREAASAALDRDTVDREAVQNAFTKSLRELPYGVDEPVMAEVVATSRRLSLARHVHNDLVRDALALRRRRLVRVFGFNRRHPLPTYFDISDPQL